MAHGISLRNNWQETQRLCTTNNPRMESHLRRGSSYTRKGKVLSMPPTVSCSKYHTNGEVCLWGIAGTTETNSTRDTVKSELLCIRTNVLATTTHEVPSLILHANRISWCDLDDDPRERGSLLSVSVILQGQRAVQPDTTLSLICVSDIICRNNHTDMVKEDKGPAQQHVQHMPSWSGTGTTSPRNRNRKLGTGLLCLFQARLARWWLRHVCGHFQKWNAHSAIWGRFDWYIDNTGIFTHWTWMGVEKASGESFLQPEETIFLGR